VKTAGTGAAQPVCGFDVAARKRPAQAAKVAIHRQSAGCAMRTGRRREKRHGALWRTTAANSAGAGWRRVVPWEPMAQDKPGV